MKIGLGVERKMYWAHFITYTTHLTNLNGCVYQNMYVMAISDTVYFIRWYNNTVLGNKLAAVYRSWEKDTGIEKIDLGKLRQLELWAILMFHRSFSYSRKDTRFKTKWNQYKYSK